MRKLMLVVAVFGGFVLSRPAPPQSVTLVAHRAYCVRSVGPHMVPAHEVKAHTDKHGRLHPAHWRTAHEYHGHRAYCVKASSALSHRHPYCVAATGPHYVPAHVVAARTDKHGVVHPAHPIAGHESSGHRAYCVGLAKPVASVAYVASVAPASFAPPGTAITTCSPAGPPTLLFIPAHVSAMGHLIYPSFRLVKHPGTCGGG